MSIIGHFRPKHGLMHPALLTSGTMKDGGDQPMQTGARHASSA
jgi:hypothetical protein